MNVNRHHCPLSSLPDPVHISYSMYIYNVKKTEIPAPGLAKRPYGGKIVICGREGNAENDEKDVRNLKQIK
jgi:hypothetical protein